MYSGKKKSAAATWEEYYDPTGLEEEFGRVSFGTATVHHSSMKMWH